MAIRASSICLQLTRYRKTRRRAKQERIRWYGFPWPSRCCSARVFHALPCARCGRQDRCAERNCEQENRGNRGKTVRRLTPFGADFQSGRLPLPVRGTGVIFGSLLRMTLKGHWPGKHNRRAVSDLPQVSSLKPQVYSLGVSASVPSRIVAQRMNWATSCCSRMRLEAA